MNGRITFWAAQSQSDFSLHVLEKKTNFVLPESLKWLFKNYSGSIPKIENKEVHIQFEYTDGSQQTEQIVCIETPENIIENWEHRRYLIDFFHHFDVDEEFVQPDHLFPIAETLGHVLYYSIGGEHDGKVYAVDNGDFGFAFVAKSLDEFFDRLYIP